ncbi:MAG: transporter substrate-binding domain-containing protein [Actinobacteria bacterium]|nr:transporter substrate-binding domain-containing protein [Actinomycetota bacterium]
MRFLKHFRLLALIAVLALAFAACGGDGDAGDEASPGEIDTATDTETSTEDDGQAADLGLVTEGVLTVCTDSPYPPMEFEEGGEFTGFDIELMREIASEMGLDGIEVINAGFEPITSGAAFASDQCDVAAASITITEEREQNVDFTDPYFEADQSLLVKKDSGFSSLEDLAGERLGVQAGTTGATYAQENKPESTEIVEFDDPGGLFPALESGDIGGVLQDIVVNQGRTFEDDTVEVVETYPTEEEYGFAVAEEGSDELLSAINEALAAVQDSGTYDEVYDEFFPEASE